MVIDFHVHMFPDRIAKKTIATLAERSSLTPHSDGSVQGTLARMKEAGVTKAVHQNIATNPHQMQKVNDFAIETNRLDEFISFGSVHPDAPDYEAELDRICEVGLKGIKLHPDYQGFFIDEPKMQPIYEAALKRGLIILFHAGLDLGLPRPVHATPEAIANTLGLFSGEKVIFAHMAGCKMQEKALEHVIGKDVYIDTSCLIDFAEPDLCLRMLKAHDENKILFATDFPWGDFSYEISGICNLDLPQEMKEKILYKNAERLLNIITE